MFSRQYCAAITIGYDDNDDDDGENMQYVFIFFFKLWLHVKKSIHKANKYINKRTVENIILSV